MKKTKMVTTKIKKEVIIDVLCNMCGESLSNSKRKGLKSEADYEGLVEAEIHCGYGSEVLGDTNSYKFSICEHCLKTKIFPSFELEVEIKGDDSNGEYVSQSAFLKKQKEKLNKELKKYLDFFKKEKYKDHTQQELKKMSFSELNELFHLVSSKKVKNCD